MGSEILFEYKATESQRFGIEAPTSWGEGLHLDRVEGLGDFLELEVVFAEGENSEAAKAEAEELLKRLGISKEHFVEGAYVDLLHP